MRRTLLPLNAVGLLTALMLVSVPTAVASVTIGQVSSTASSGCDPNADRLQTSVSSGNSYAVPSVGNVTAWTVSSWNTFAGTSSGAQMSMKVFRLAGGGNYTAVGHDGPRTLTPGALNTFPASVQVKSGDFLGLNTVTTNVACYFSAAAGDNYLYSAGDHPDGSTAAFGTGATVPNSRLNVSAVLDPTNTFTLGAITLNKKRGTATEAVNVPNPGTVTVSGNGVKTASSSGARAAISVPGAGTVRVRIRAKGKKKRKLNSTGKVKLSPAITYVPTGGTANSMTAKVRLKKKH